jgi:hypothetical protein
VTFQNPTTYGGGVLVTYTTGNKNAILLKYASIDAWERVYL